MAALRGVVGRHAEHVPDLERRSLSSRTRASGAPSSPFTRSFVTRTGFPPEIRITTRAPRPVGHDLHVLDARLVVAALPVERLHAAPVDGERVGIEREALPDDEPGDPPARPAPASRASP